LPNSNKQHLTPVEVYVNNAPSIGNQSVHLLIKFHLNLPKQTIVTAAFVKSPKALQFSGSCVWSHLQRETVFRVTFQKLL